MTSTDKRLGALSLAEKRALLADILRKQNEHTSSRTTAPLSFAQRRLWFLHQLSPESPFYSIPIGLRLSAPLDPEILERCINEIVRRHEILRTTFPAPDGKPVQSIAAHLHISLERVDLRGHPEPRAEAQRMIVGFARRPFDLTCGPLLRAWLFDEATDSQILLLLLHHIVADGWSLGVLMRELSTLYSAFGAGRPSPLPPMTVQYADFATWQNEELRGPTLERLLSYWRHELKDLPTLTLPTDHPRPPVASFRGARHFVAYPAALTTALRGLGEKESCTLFMTLLSAFFVLLHRYTGQQDLALGSAIANRTRPELEGLLGFFVNSLVLRGDLSGDPDFRQLLSRVRAVALDAYAHQDLPFERLVEELQPERSLDRNPLVQVMFALQNAPADGLEGEGIDSLEIERGTANFDLVVDLWERPDGRLGGRFEYSTDLFDDATIRRMSGHFERLLEGIVSNPERAISRLPMITAPERKQILETWTATTTPYPADRGLIELFEVQVERDPEAPALVRGQTTSSFRALDIAATRLAHHLIGLGVGPGTLVAIFLDRSFELIAAQLAVLKIGGAYVPLDLEYPASRLALILKETEAPVLVSRRTLAERLPPSPARTLWVDADRTQIDAMPAELQRRPSSPDALAHVIYTSGSTGRPKGICVAQRGVARLVLNTDYITLGPGDRIAHASNTAFDASTFEIWGALLCGATLVIVEREVILSPNDLAAFLVEQRITTLFVTTALFNQIAATHPGAFASLRELLFGGDQVDPRRVREVLAGGAPSRLLHVYGPTESTTFATWELVREVREDALTVPIGRPVANTTAYILDAAMEPTPIGVPGDLYLGGDGLALGYFKHPELTAAYFVANPLAEERIYRTGDIVRWRPNGSIEFLHRADTQVKIRGFRIEPSEIEALLSQHPSVREVAVLAPEFRGERRLVAYVVRDNGDARRADTSGVDDWRQVYDEVIYEDIGACTDPTLNTTGWRSSYTGEALSEAEMREQVEQTVARIRSVRPRRVLEIGCGTGMLLFKVAPECETYWATDFSDAALRFVEGVLDAKPLPQVTLLKRTAIDFSGIDPETFDLVVLNSVIQYFPSAEYLSEVLAQAARVLRSGGHILCGDVRGLPLLSAFHTDVELTRAADDLKVAQLRARIQRSLLQEDELVLDPTFFFALDGELPRVGAASVWPKRGRHHNELTCFRYDALLAVGGDAATEPASAWERRSWHEFGAIEALLDRLDRCAPETLCVVGVPNSRTAKAVQGSTLLSPGGGLDDEATVGEIRRRSSTEAESTAVDPEDLWDLAASRPYEVEVRLAEGDEGRLDLLLRRRGVRRAWPRQVAAWRGSPRDYANDPNSGRCAKRLAPELRAFLLGRLPEYMVPTSFVTLASMPLTPNGKLDRHALPPIEDVQELPTAGYVAPRNETEAALVPLWAEVLGVERVGVHDNFFELGGHSLLVTSLVSKVRDTLHLEVSIRAVFEAPTVAAFAASFAESSISTERSPALDRIPRQPRDGAAALSFAQERLWFLAQMFPESRVYNIRTEIRPSTRLEAPVLRRCLKALGERHEILRTTFSTREDRPVQVIAERPELPLEVIDLRPLPATEREPSAARHIATSTERRFDLERGPLLRAALFELGEDKQILLVVVHHIVADGWSLGVLFRELAALYPALSSGTTPALPELSIQYADFAAWQRRHLSGPALAPLLSYWRQRLSGVPTLRIPTDAPRVAAPAHRGRQRSLALLPGLSADVLALGRAEGCTLFMTVLTALFAVLHGYSGQTDFAIGSPIANRTRAELEGLIGFFLNTLVLRADLGGDPSFLMLMERVRDTALGAYAHQELPFELLLQELRLERELSRTPLFQVFFNVLNFADADIGDSVLRSDGDPDDDVAQFDLALYAGEVDDRIVFQLIYDADLFAQATAQRLLTDLQELLSAATREPTQKLSRLLFSGRSVQPPRPRLRPPGRFEPFDAGTVASIPRRFFEIASREPNRVAVVTDDARCTYRELAAQAAGIAAAIDGERVALLFDPGVAMSAALLGALAAGAAYVPLDPAHPTRRLQAILGLAEASTILVEATYHGLAVEVAGATTSVVDIDAIAPVDPPPAQPSISADALAYILFTSGSTGEPKGVIQSHSNVLHHIGAYTDALQITADDGVTLLSTYSFDAAVMDIFGALLNGATLYAVNLRKCGFSALAEALDTHPITIYHSTPTVFRHAMAELAPDRTFPTVRAVVLGGEEVIAADLDRFRRHFVRGSVFVNGLGPTESTLALQLFLDHGTTVGRPSVPVGYPVAGTEVYLLDAEGREVAPYEVGEIVIESPHVALGYWRRQELTDEAFSSGAPGSPRRFRTGDLGRRLPDMSVEFIGRKDSQVKIRGQRVELGEIEARLAEHPSILQAAAALHSDTQGEPRLYAYAVLRRGGQAPTLSTVRRFLQLHLPDAMMPAAFIPLSTLPLTMTGKLDRQALPPAPEALPTDCAPARTSTEAALSGLMAELLGIKRVGMDDDFFLIGGHSLLATQFVSRVREMFGVELLLRQVFESPTPAALARAVARATKAEKSITRQSRDRYRRKRP